MYFGLFTPQQGYREEVSLSHHRFHMITHHSFCAITADPAAITAFIFMYIRMKHCTNNIIFILAV